MEQIHLTREELQNLISAGVTEAFVRLGIQVDDPLEMQRDFQHLRAWRTGMQTVTNKSLVALVLLLLSGGVGVFLMGIKQYFGKG